MPSYTIDQVVVTATRTERSVKDIPAQVEVITEEEIKDFPVSNIDDLLRSAANVYVNRSWGIFSKNSAVTMRGLQSSDRTLILIDGVPKNKLSGGSVNWHNINPDIVDRIEVIKGPASALYGTNSMGGVINIITKKPKDELSGSVKAFAGRYKSLGSSLDIAGSNIKEGKGLYWGINGFYRQGDGYIFEPAEALDSTDTETYLQEYGGGTKIGYQISEKQSIEVIYDYYDELRGGGRQVFLEDGSYDSFLTQQVRTLYKADIGEGKLQILLHYLDEDYNNQKESLNNYNEYRISEATTHKTDKGGWVTYSGELIKNNYFTAGAEARIADVKGDEVYYTSPDVITYEGYMSVYAVFVQDEISMLNNKLKIIAGLRGDLVDFTKGWQQVDDPTKVTGFPESFYESFTPNHWFAVSPKLAVQYTVNSLNQVYINYATGFKHPKIDDLCKSGKIRKGFKLANPELKPEVLHNYEIGYSRHILKDLDVNTAVYYSIGNNFQYLEGTGDSIDTGGSELKPVMQRKNIAGIQVMGAEISLKYRLNKNIKLDASYSYNNSIILDYDIPEDNPSKDLTGLFLAEVSPHLFYSGITWRNKYLTFNVNCNYSDEQWVDDENTWLVDDYFIVNIRLSKDLRSKYRLWFDVRDIFDVEYVDRKGQLSPGRYYTGGVRFAF